MRDGGPCDVIHAVIVFKSGSISSPGVNSSKTYCFWAMCWVGTEDNGSCGGWFHELGAIFKIRIRVGRENKV